jgi:hypothetical protein
MMKNTGFSSLMRQSGKLLSETCKEKEVNQADAERQPIWGQTLILTVCIHKDRESGIEKTKGVNGEWWGAERRGDWRRVAGDWAKPDSRRWADVPLHPSGSE